MSTPTSADLSGDPPVPERPKRSVRLVRSPAEDGIGVICVTLGHRSNYYTIVEIPCQIGGRGFVIHRLGLGTVYHVRVGQPADCECECKGFLYHGYCRHVLGLLALIRQGKL